MFIALRMHITDKLLPRLAGRPDERWRSRLRCFLDVSVLVSGASVSDVRIIILLPLGGSLTNGSWSYRGEC
jgi:hypothetical protein